MAPVTIRSAARGWYEGSTTVYWTARNLWDTGTALYAVVQDTGVTFKLRVVKADSRTAPTAFTEQDSANNKSVPSATTAYSSWYDPATDMLHIIAFSTLTVLTHYR